MLMHGTIPLLLHGVHSDNFPSTSNPLLNKANPVSLTHGMLPLAKSPNNDKRQHHTIITKNRGGLCLNQGHCMLWTKWKWACWSGVFWFSPASNHYNEALQSSIIILKMYYRHDYLAQSKVLVTLESHPVLHVHRKYPTLAWSQQVHSKCTKGHRPDNKAPFATGTHSKFHHGVRSATHIRAKKRGLTPQS